VRLTKRGERVFLLGLAVMLALALLGIYKAAISVHWTGGGYCVGSFTQCYEEEGEK
jgi:hypothetical protein